MVEFVTSYFIVETVEKHHDHLLMDQSAKESGKRGWICVAAYKILSFTGLWAIDWSVNHSRELEEDGYGDALICLILEKKEENNSRGCGYFFLKQK